MSYNLSTSLCSHTYTLVIAWGSVAFSVFSLGIIVYKAYQDSSRIRHICVVMSLSTIGLAIGNALRIQSQIPEAPYLMLRSALMILFVDLMVAITLNLGGNFYTMCSRVNRLYWASIATTAALNVMVFVGLLLQYGAGIPEAGTIVINVERCSWPIVLFLTYWYAFYPVVNQMSAVDNVPAAVVAVGAWYLMGMGLLLLLEMVTIILSIPYPPSSYKEFDINRAAASIVVRMAMLTLYSSPPSRKLIFLIRRTFFSSSFIVSLDRSPDPPCALRTMPSATGTLEPKDDNSFASSTTRIIGVA